MKFEKYRISAAIKKNLSRLDFKKPTDIQFKAIPPILRGEDVLAIAQTGTGKTAAFAIPVIDKIHAAKSSGRSLGIKCVVMVPTRELAEQIGEVFNLLAKHTKVKSFALYGGVDQDPQIRKLQEGVDILIATPGRMFDLVSQKYINPRRVDTFVLDEADHMLDLGFIEDIRCVDRILPRKRQTLFFSATINKKIKKLAFSLIKSSAIRIEISPKDPVAKNVSHYVMFVQMDDKRFFLERFIRENPESRIIVFVRTRVRAERVTKAMGRVDIPALVIHGDKDQLDRAEVMSKFKNGESNILVATDVSARGIDIADVHFVVNYDLPEKPENYVHRVGRTGRGVNKGSAVSFCSENEKKTLEEIQLFLNKEIEVIKVGKKDYNLTVSPPPEEEDMDLKELMEYYNGLDEKKKNKKKKRKKTKKRLKPAKKTPTAARRKF